MPKSKLIKIKAFFNNKKISVVILMPIFWLVLIGYVLGIMGVVNVLQNPQNIQGPQGPRGLQGPKGDDATSQSATFLRLGAPISYEKTAFPNGKNGEVFGALKYWLNPERLPEIIFNKNNQRDKIIFHPFNQKVQNDKKFYIGDELYFDFQLFFKTISSDKHFGLNINFELDEQPLSNAYVKVLNRDKTNVKKNFMFIKTVSKSPVSLIWAPGIFSHISARGYIIFKTDAIYIYMPNSLVDYKDTLSDFYSITKVDWPLNEDLDAGVILKSIEFGAVNGNTGEFINQGLDAFTQYHMNSETIVSFRESLQNRQLGLKLNSEYKKILD